MEVGSNGVNFHDKIFRNPDTFAFRNVKSPNLAFIICVSYFHAIMKVFALGLECTMFFFFGDFVWVHLFEGCKLGFLREVSLLVILQTSHMLLHTEQVSKSLFHLFIFLNKSLR